jgi:trehalose 6-phosphate phosphatase
VVSTVTRPLFSKSGRQELKKLKSRPFLIGLDFDGTLVPIVTHAHEAKLSVKTYELLKKLAEKRPTVILSGRAKKDVQKLLKQKFIRVVGNHGIEGLPLKVQNKKAILRQIQNWAHTLSLEVIGLPGVELENKNFSLSLHYRNSPSRGHMRRHLLRLISNLEPKPRLIDGKSVLNILVAGGGDKGSALRQLMHEYHCARSIYIGDDCTDEEVFKLSQKKVLSVRIGASKRSAACFHLSRQAEVLRLLKTLAE